MLSRPTSRFSGVTHAVALSSGTAALHLGLIGLGVGPGDRVVVPSLTFGATAFAVTYVGARPVFIDSEPHSWNIDPDLLADYLADAARRAAPGCCRPGRPVRPHRRLRPHPAGMRGSTRCRCWSTQPSPWGPCTTTVSPGRWARPQSSPSTATRS